MSVGRGKRVKGSGTMTRRARTCGRPARNAKLKYAGNVREPESRYSIIAGLPRLQLVPDAVIRSRGRARTNGVTPVNEVTRPQSNHVGPTREIQLSSASPIFCQFPVPPREPRV